MDTIITHLFKLVMSLPFCEMVNRYHDYFTANSESVSIGPKIDNYDPVASDQLGTVEDVSIESSPCIDKISEELQNSKPHETWSDSIHWKFFVGESSFGTDHPMQDAVCVNEARYMAAIADGVSQSLMPELFSKELVSNWCQLTTAKIDVTSWFAASCTKWFEHVLGRYELLTPFEQNWYLRGASSTFCGLSVITPTDIEVWHVGDIVLFLICESRVDIACPETYISDVKSPASLNVHHDVASIDMIQRKVFDVSDVSAVVICTDAIGDFLAECKDKTLFRECINSVLSSESAFTEFCIQKCLEGQLRPDDYSIIIMKRVKV